LNNGAKKGLMMWKYLISFCLLWQFLLYGVNGNPEPPTDLTGRQIKNDFAVVVEYNNLLEWQASPTSPITGYWIYRNDEPIVKVKSTTLYYYDLNVKRNTDYTYSITAVNELEEQSSPISITIKG
jgi:hypothetical protein